MNTRFLPILAVAIWACPGKTWADDPRAVVEKAISAYGGEANVARLACRHIKSKGTLLIGAGAPFTMETFVQLPDRFKSKIVIEFGGQKAAIVEVLNGNKSWGTANGVPGPVADRKVAELQANLFMFRSLSLKPLLSDSTIQISAIDDADVDGKPAAGVKASTEKQHDLRMWFDKSTGLLAKLERTVYDDGAKRDVQQEDFHSDYKPIDGIPTAMKQEWRRGGRKLVEIEVVDAKYPQRIDAREFSEPVVDLPFRVTPEVIYGRKLGMALTFDVYMPKANANGAAVVYAVSGGWYSERFAPGPNVNGFVSVLVKRGYTVFAVCHGSQPIFTIPEAVADMNRSVRFIRLHASEYHVDPDRIGITGGSAGGHLSLMQGLAGDTGKKDSKDPLEQMSSRVQAVACFYPPTDFLNYDGDGKYAFAENGVLAGFRTAIDVREMDPKTHRLEHMSDAKQREIARQVSPINFVSADDPPTLIIHGDADKLVPISQAKAIIAKLESVGVPAKLITKPGAEHGWGGMETDIAKCADWFDTYLTKK